MKVKNDLFVGGDTEFRDTAGDVYFKALGGVLNADTLSMYIGDVDGVGLGGLLEIDVINSRLLWNEDLRLSGYTSSATARIDNTVNYALGVDATGNVKMIEKSTLDGSASEAFSAYLGTGGGSIGTTSTLVNYNTTGFNSNTDVFNLTSGVITVDVDMTAAISFTVSCANPSLTRTSVRAHVEVSTDGGSNWSEVLGSRCWAYIRTGTNNDDNTLGGSTIIRSNTSGDKYRVMCQAMDGTVSIINYASNITIHDLSGGAAGPTGPAGADGSSGTIDDVLGNGSTATNKTLTMSGTGGIMTSGTTGITVTGTGGFSQQNGPFEFYDGNSAGFSLHDVDDVNTFTSSGSVSGNSLLHDFVAGKLKLSSYGGEAITGTAGSLLAVDTSGNVIEESIPGSFSSSKVASFTILPTTSSQSITADSGTMYIVNLASTSGLSITMPSSANAGDEIWIGGNGTTSVHANRFSVSGKLFDTGSSIWTFGGDNSSPDYRFGAKDCIKWIWTGTYWFETTHKIQ